MSDRFFEVSLQVVRLIKVTDDSLNEDGVYNEVKKDFMSIDLDQELNVLELTPSDLADGWDTKYPYFWDYEIPHN